MKNNMKKTVFFVQLKRAKESQSFWSPKRPQKELQRPAKVLRFKMLIKLLNDSTRLEDKVFCFHKKKDEKNNQDHRKNWAFLNKNSDRFKNLLKKYIKEIDC